MVYVLHTTSLLSDDDTSSLLTKVYHGQGVSRWTIRENGQLENTAINVIRTPLEPQWMGNSLSVCLEFGSNFSFFHSRHNYWWTIRENRL